MWDAGSGPDSSCRHCRLSFCRPAPEAPGPRPSSAKDEKRKKRRKRKGWHPRKRFLWHQRLFQRRRRFRLGDAPFHLLLLLLKNGVRQKKPLKWTAKSTHHRRKGCCVNRPRMRKAGVPYAGLFFRIISSARQSGQLFFLFQGGPPETCALVAFVLGGA